MEKIKKVVSLLLIAIIFLSLSSCNPFSDNILESAQVSKEAEDSYGNIEQFLENTIEPTEPKIIELDQALLDIWLTFFPGEGEQYKDDVLSFIHHVFPASKDATIEFKIESIPLVDNELHQKLISLNAPQDIRYLEGIFGRKVEGIASNIVSYLLKLTKALMGKEGQTEDLFHLKDFITIPSDSTRLTNGDLLMLEIFLNLIFETVPEAVSEDYNEYLQANPGADIESYIKNVNPIRLLTRRNVINKLTYTYTFLNKYNSSITIFNMDEFASIFF